MIHTMSVYCALWPSHARRILDNLGVSSNKNSFKGAVNVNGIAEVVVRSRGKDYGYLLRVIVNPAKLLYGFDAFETVTPEILDDLTVAFARAIEEATGDEDIARTPLPDWLVHRIDFAVDVRTPYVDQYLMLFDKGDKPSNYKEKYNWRKGSCYWESRSVRINVYSKSKQMRDAGKSPESIERAKNILRFEIQCRSPKVGYIRKAKRLEDRRLRNFFCEEYAGEVLTSYCKRVYKTGDYYKRAAASKRMKRLGMSARRREANEKILRAIAQTRSISEARRQLSETGIVIKNTKSLVKLEYSPEQFSRNCRSLIEANINPVVIPKDWEVSYLPSIFHLIEPVFADHQSIEHDIA
jgi:hypothetical protein